MAAGLDGVSWRFGLLGRALNRGLRARGPKAGDARQCGPLPMSRRHLDEALRDSGLSPEDLLGRPVTDPDTPFFLRPDFGTRRG